MVLHPPHPWRTKSETPPPANLRGSMWERYQDTSHCLVHNCLYLLFLSVCITVLAHKLHIYVCTWKMYLSGNLKFKILYLGESRRVKQSINKINQNKVWTKQTKTKYKPRADLLSSIALLSSVLISLSLSLLSGGHGVSDFVLHGREGATLFGV